MEWLDIPPADQIASIFFFVLTILLIKIKLLKVKNQAGFFFLIQEYLGMNFGSLNKKNRKKEKNGNCATFSILNC